MQPVMSVPLRTATEVSSFYSLGRRTLSRDEHLGVVAERSSSAAHRDRRRDGLYWRPSRPAPARGGLQSALPGAVAQETRGRDWTSDPRVEVWPSDLDDHTSLIRDLSGCDVAFYLVHSMMSSDRAYADHDLALALTFAAAARDAGVGRIIYLGGLGEMGSGLSKHLESRRHVETALASTGVPVTVLRAAMIIGSGSASFEIMRYLVQRLPVMITPTWVSTRCQPIAIENVSAIWWVSCPRPTRRVRSSTSGGGRSCPTGTSCASWLKNSTCHADGSCRCHC